MFNFFLDSAQKGGGIFGFVVAIFLSISKHLIICLSIKQMARAATAIPTTEQ